jgi:hypothetical protein
MKRYIEPSPRARQLFFLALALLAAFAVVVARLDRILPPLSSNPTVALDQGAARLLFASAFSSVFYGALAFFVVRMTYRSIRCKQWPPVGMPVPFRTAIREIRHPRVEWILMSFGLVSLAFLAALPWLGYAQFRNAAAEISALSVTPNHSIERTAAGKPASAAHVER